jgi:hypothetical protein
MALADSFGVALAIAATRADRLDTTSQGTGIVLGLSGLQTTAEPFEAPNYQAMYNARPLEVFQDFSSRTESFYQQIHALGEAVARLVSWTATPRISASNLGALAETVEVQQHPLAGAVRARRREIALLRWLATVRNKAVQHRAANGYTDNKAIVLSDGFALLRKPAPPDPTTTRKARAMLTGLGRQYGVRLDTNGGDREIFAYLDLVSHSLWREHPARADPARQLVRDAGLHYLVMSAPMIANVAWSFGRVLELAEEHPNAVKPGNID